MGRGNDAIPTWSGFNYQGKITLLVVLQTINCTTTDLEQYSLEVEKTEDFVLKKSGASMSFYQVKAYPTQNSWKAYYSTDVKKNALGKLIQHRDDTLNKVIDAPCYLCTCNKILDWDDVGNAYRNLVIPYKYDNQFVSLLSVVEKIKKEIGSYLNNNSLPAHDVNIIYGELCSFIDFKVFEMHKTESSQRNFDIPIMDFVLIINQACKLQRSRNDSHLKEAVYLHLAENLQIAMDDFCGSVCHVGNMGDSGQCNQCGVPHSFDAISSLTNGSMLEF